MRIKQSINVYYRQWDDYFDYLKIDLVLPEICVNDHFISDEIFHGQLWINRLDNEIPFWRFRICADNCFRVESSESLFELRLSILGFGVSVLRQRGY